MSTKKSDNIIETPANQTNEAAAPAVAISGQYIKDLSFENPNAPASLANQKEAPKIEVSLNIEAKGLQENMYEVALKVTAKATSENNTLFVAELSYAGLFTLNNVTDEQKELVLLIHCPTILFPFARRVLSDATRDGGFQPLMLEPTDFAALYQQRKAQETPEVKA
jgi:preprotein translocase subunit SecB